MRIVLAALLLALSGITAAAVPAKKPAPAPLPAKVRFAAGDAAFKERAGEARAREALKIYREAFKLNPADFEAAWRVSAACYFVGIRLTPDEDEREKLYDEGKRAGDAGAALDPRCAPCFFWSAINAALYGDSVGVFKMFFSLGEIRERLKKTLELDPAYAGAGAHRLLGLIEQKLPGILGGSDDRAREHFGKAIETAPREPLNYLFMARLLEDAFDEKESALLVARKGLAVPKPGPDQPESIDALRDLADFLKEHSSAD